TSHRAPGRPRDARCDEAIIEATLHTLASSGFAGLSMEAVASRAGVGKATVYRRWATKDALVADALATLVDNFEPIDTGSLRDDLVAWLNAVRRHNIQTLSGQIMPRLLAEKESHPELFDTYRERVLAPSRARVAVVLRRGVDSGELAEDLDVDLVIDMLVGPVAYRQYTSGRHEVSGGRIGAVVDTVLEGIRRRRAAS
nr:TetR/AcrR family transcriptional regulator [Micromonospora sp. DSM 115978]